MDTQKVNALFNIGDIVKFILGDSTPHLLIEGIETIAEKAKTQFKYRCRWFVGQKTGEFKETWLLESVLQLKQEAHTNHSFEIGQKVQLATFKFELTETQKNGLLTQEPTLYYPPVMVIIGQNSKNAIFHAKCLYYNLNLNKFSEIWIPYTSLSMLKP